MPAFMLDTDTVSFALRGEGRVGQNLLAHKPSDVCMSSITLAELRYGAHHRGSARLHRLIDAFTASVAIVDFDAGAADRFGRVAAALARRGTPIGGYDALIAAQALSLGVTLVTNNLRHFRQVGGLRAETWV